MSSLDNKKVTVPSEEKCSCGCTEFTTAAGLDTSRTEKTTAREKYCRRCGKALERSEEVIG